MLQKSLLNTHTTPTSNKAITFMSFFIYHKQIADSIDT